MAMGGTFAAASGIIGAVEVVIGLMAIPLMLRQGYAKDLVAGTITAAGSLGTIIPPSVICVVYGGIGQLPVSDLFAGCLLPGLVMVGLFLAYILGRSLLRPADAPAPRTMTTQPSGMPPLPDRPGPRDRLLITLSGLVPTAALIAAVLGSILAGIASPTEAAAVGALGAMLLALLYGRLTGAILGEALAITLRVTSFILLIVFGGGTFSSVFYVLGGGGIVRDLVEVAGAGPQATVALFLAIVFVMGFVLDWATILLITVPIFMPVLRDDRGRPALVRDPDDRRATDELSDAADGAGHLLPAVHRPTRAALRRHGARGPAVRWLPNPHLVPGLAVPDPGNVAARPARRLLTRTALCQLYESSRSAILRYASAQKRERPVIQNPRGPVAIAGDPESPACTPQPGWAANTQGTHNRWKNGK